MQEGGVLVGRATGIGEALADAGMGGFESDRLVAPEAEAAPSAGRDAARAGRI